MQTIGKIGSSGEVKMRVIRAKRAPLLWRIRNWMRLNWWRGLLGVITAKAYSQLTGVMTAHASLRIRLIKKSGEVIDYGVVSRMQVTDAGVAYLAQDFNNAASSADVSLFNFHGLGTGATAEAANQTGLITECTTALNPSSTRATGTRSNPAGGQYRSVGTLTFGSAAAVTEHGVFTQAATGGGTLLDRSVFSALNVDNGDSIQSTYTITFNSGG